MHKIIIVHFNPFNLSFNNKCTPKIGLANGSCLLKKTTIYFANKTKQTIFALHAIEQSYDKSKQLKTSSYGPGLPKNITKKLMHIPKSNNNPFLFLFFIAIPKSNPNSALRRYLIHGALTNNQTAANTLIFTKICRSSISQNATTKWKRAILNSLLLRPTSQNKSTVICKSGVQTQLHSHELRLHLHFTLVHD
jgi:hypothetical protein